MERLKGFVKELDSNDSERDPLENASTIWKEMGGGSGLEGAKCLHNVLQGMPAGAEVDFVKILAHSRELGLVAVRRRVSTQQMSEATIIKFN